MKEIWKDIEGYEGFYQISNMGRVKSLDRIVLNKSSLIKKYDKRKGRILKRKIGTDGYKNICLSREGKKKFLKISRLVANAFICNYNNCPQVNHIDGNKQNDNVNNLEWCTRSENIKHAYRIGLMSRKGEKHNRSILTDNDASLIYKLRNEYKIKQYILVKLFNIEQSTISRISNKRAWAHIHE